MGLRNAKLLSITRWAGLDSFTDPTETPPEAFVASSNVVVSPTGNVLTLRSPANYNTALSTTNKVLSGVDYERTAGNAIVFDINTSSGSNVATYVTTGGANTSLRTGQANAAWQSLNVNNDLYRVNGAEFMQITTALTVGSVYRVGIVGPLLACTASIVAGGSGTLAVGVYASYAYYNSTTVHTGQCSDASGLSGPTSGSNDNVRIAVVASTQTGVDKIVLFFSEDGGVTRFLLIDSNGDPQLFSNSTGNIDVSVANIFLNLNVEETAFNAPPPTGITFISRWKNRIMGAIGRTWAYSGFDQISMGVPWEAWPPLNLIVIPNKGETAKGAIETPVGSLHLSDRNAYLLSGQPTDKVDSGENTIQVTEQFDQLGWNIGTRSPKTMQNTPYGTVFFDNNKHLQLWPWQDQPLPMALGVWPDLAAIQDTDAAMAMAEASWFPAGGANGGFYVLTASTSGSTNNKMWIIMMIRTSEGLLIAPCPSSIAAQTTFSARVNGELRSFIGVTDRIREILDFDLAGAGWAATDQLYFDIVVGNQLTNFNRLHSLELNGTRPQDAIIRVSDMDQDGNAVNGETIPLFQEQGSYWGIVDRYAPRHRVQIAFPNDDSGARQVQNIRFTAQLKKRAI